MLQTLMGDYGYPFILIGTFLEGETVLILGGLAAKLGYLELSWVMVCAFVGALCGDQLCFFLGRYHGKTMLAKHPQWQRRADWVHRHLERHQILLILSFRFIYGARSVTPFVIGMSRVPTSRFILLHLVATALWAVVVGAAGYAFGKAVEVFLGDLQELQLYVLGIIVLVSLAIWLYQRRYRRFTRAQRVPSQRETLDPADSAGEPSFPGKAGGKHPNPDKMIKCGDRPAEVLADIPPHPHEINPTSSNPTAYGAKENRLMTTTNQALQKWVEDVARLTRPERIHWCTGSEEEYQTLIEQMLASEELHPLNHQTYPNCYLHRSHPSDVARTEHLTFICTRNPQDAGPNNNWMDPEEAHSEVDALFKGAMHGRTLYVIPYCMGPLDSPDARCGVEITDSPYVVANMRIMTRMGDAALKRIEREGSFVKGLHSIGDLDPERRFIMHFPEEMTIKSIGSGYGGNALLSKKCHALRLASWQARREGWLAEHMLIVGIENPAGETHYIAAAFPSACGKTNLAMLIPPASMPGYKVWTLGDDIAWLHLGEDGRLWAINPEAGFFGVAPGTSAKTNPNALKMVSHDTLFTNVAVTENNEPWWEGKSKELPKLNWRGEPYDPAKGPAAHPNARFTTPLTQCPSYSERAEDPAGVPISAIIFGGRRAELAPLVFEAENWCHGVLVGASMASETTAAATGAIGVVRRDPMAMKPFCGYNYADYWNHWLSFADKSDRLPKVFHVNWFRQDQNGKFIWPGFCENLRVLKWILERCKGKTQAESTPIGKLPHPEDIDMRGLDITPQAMRTLLSVDPEKWLVEFEHIRIYFEKFGDRLPRALWDEHQRVMDNLQQAPMTASRTASSA